MNNLRKVSVRRLQHNLSDYLDLAKTVPLLITKYGEEEAILLNPKSFKISENNRSSKSVENIMLLPFIGFHKNRKSWKTKTSAQIGAELRQDAWYGK